MSGVFRSIGRAIERVVRGVVDIVRGVVNFVGDIVGFVFNPMGSFDVPTPQNVPADQQAQGVTITKNGTNVSIPVIYGYRRVGGTLVFVETKGDRNQFLICCVPICEGEIEGVRKILLDDIELPGPSTFGNTGSSGTYVHGRRYTVGSGRYSGLVEMQIYNGRETNSSTNSQVLSGDYSGGGDTSWVAKDRRLPGVAYAAFQFKYPRVTADNQENFPWKGGLPKIQFDVFGKKVYDVSSHTVGSLTLANDYDNLSKRYHGNVTTDAQGDSNPGVVGTNPANVLLDYLMNDRYGCGIPKEQIDAESFRKVAQKCKHTMTYYLDNGVTRSGPILTTNAVIDTNNKLMDNVRILVSGNRGIMPYVGGRYKLKMEDGGTSLDDPTETDVAISFAVDSDYVVGGITLDGERKNSKFNEVIVNYVDPDKEFTNQQVVYTVSGDQSSDNNEKLSKEFTFHTMTNYSMAETTAKQIYNKSRSQKSVQFTGTQELLDVEVGDIITITDTNLQLSAAQFRVAAMKLNANFTVDISAVEHNASNYPFVAGTPYPVAPAIFQPDELVIRPRQRVIADPPIGIIPPVSPSPDSADESVIDNDPPETPDPVIETIQSFDATPTDSARITAVSGGQYRVNTPAGALLVDLSSSSAIPTFDVDKYGGRETETRDNNVITSSGSLEGGDWIFYRDTNGLYEKRIALFYFSIIQPTHTGINLFRIKYYDSTGNFLRKEDFPANAGQTVSVLGQFAGSKIENCEVRWVQNLQGVEVEHQDGSNLGSIVTFRDSVRGKNIRGNNIEAYLNYYLQDTDARLLGNDNIIRATAPRITFEVDLGA